MLFFKRTAMEKIFNTSRCLYLKQKKKKNVHIAFQKSISDYDCFDKIIELISDEWEKRKIFFEGYELMHLRLITSLKWRFDYFSKRKKEKMDLVLDKLYENLVDVHEMFIKKYYIVRISQSKRGNIYI